MFYLLIFKIIVEISSLAHSIGNFILITWIFFIKLISDETWKTLLSNTWVNNYFFTNFWRCETLYIMNSFLIRAWLKQSNFFLVSWNNLLKMSCCRGERLLRNRFMAFQIWLKSHQIFHAEFNQTTTFSFCQNRTKMVSSFE